MTVVRAVQSTMMYIKGGICRRGDGMRLPLARTIRFARRIEARRFRLSVDS